MQAQTRVHIAPAGRGFHSRKRSAQQHNAARALAEDPTSLREWLQLGAVAAKAAKQQHTNRAELALPLPAGQSHAPRGNGRCTRH
jgi:hypothetical protein